MLTRLNLFMKCFFVMQVFVYFKPNLNLKYVFSLHKAYRCTLLKVF